jgi:lipoic acid synthetase
VIAELKKLEPRPTVEVLTPDFRGDTSAVDAVLAAAPDVYNHNVETVRRLYPQVRRQGRYDWALEVIGRVARHGNGLVTKSGLMVGLGEQRPELEETLRDIASARCQVVTIGQYLRPTSKEVPVVRYWSPQEFAELEGYGRSLGLEVIAGPFVRSSYHAEEAFLRVSGAGSAAADE